MFKEAEAELCRISRNTQIHRPPSSGAPDLERQRTHIAATLSIALRLGVMIIATQAAGRTLIVTDTNDTTRVTSLRGAVIQANHLGGFNTLVLTRTNYELTIPGPGGGDALCGELVIKGNLAIIGKSTGEVVLSGSGLGDRVLHVLPHARLTLSGLVITGGAPAGEGGGIHNEGTLVMHDCTVVGNRAGGPDLDGHYGGGIYNAGIAIVRNCVVFGNYGGTPFAGNGGNGGGIANLGTMEVDGCAISGNAGGNAVGVVYRGNGDGLIVQSIGAPGVGGSGGSGGGIYNLGRLSLHACTISGNAAGSGSDGAYGGDGGVGGGGGGIYNAGRLNVNTCTISGNSAGHGGDGSVGGYRPEGEPVGTGGNGGSGGGVLGAEGASSVLRNTVVTLNKAGGGGSGGVPYGLGTPAPSGATGSGPDLSGIVVSR